MIFTQPQPNTELARIYKASTFDPDGYGNRPRYVPPARFGTNIMFTCFDKKQYYRNLQYQWFADRGITCFRDLWDFSEVRSDELLDHSLTVINEMGKRGADVVLCLLGAGSWQLNALSQSQRNALLNYVWEQTGNPRYCGKLAGLAYRAAGHKGGIQLIQDWLGEKYELLSPVMDHVLLELENEIRNWKPVDPLRHKDFLKSIGLDPVNDVAPIEVPDSWKPRNLEDLGITPVHAYNDWSPSLNRGVQWQWNLTAGTKRWWATECGSSPEFHFRAPAWMAQQVYEGAERVYTHTDVLCAHVMKDWDTPGATWRQYVDKPSFFHKLLGGMTGQEYALSKAGGILQHDGISVLVPEVGWRLAATRFELAQG